MDAFEVAICRRKPAPDLIHHTDQGVVYTILSLGKRLEEVGIVPSMCRVCSALDNAIPENFAATLAEEGGSRESLPISSRQAVKTAPFKYIDGFYNRRIHSSLGHSSPATFGEDIVREVSAA